VGVPFLTVSFQGDGEGSAGARTDARGAYQAVGMEPGSYRVHVSGEYVSFQTEYVVTGSAEFDIDITGGAIAGRVVRADGGAPLPGVEVSFFLLGGSENKPEGSATTTSQGTFAERSLREGRYRLITSKPGFGQEVRDVEVTRGGKAEVLLELSPADGVSVTVVDARDSRPLEAIVVVRDQARRIVANRHSGVDEQGLLNIPLADGSYLLSTSASGYGTVTVPVTAPTQGLRIGLTPGGTLVIESARDLKGRVRLVQPDGEEYVRCWCNGIAEIQLKGRRTTVENVTPGNYTVQIVDSVEPTEPRPVAIREGQTTTLSID
jgi:Carboxypeptidase regulatory-like domain